MAAVLYFGPYDNGSPILPGSRPDWMNPHDPDYKNPAFTVTAEKSGAYMVSVAVRNHGTTDAHNVFVMLEVCQLAGPFSLLGEWNDISVPAFNPKVDVHWESNPVDVNIPDPNQGYVLRATLNYPGPPPEGPSDPDPATDPCVGIWTFSPAISPRRA